MRILKGFLLTLVIILAVGSVNLRALAMPVAQNGVADLTAMSLDQVVSLNGEWEFYWNKFL